MSTYREAVLHVRRGGTARRSGKEIRFLTFEEAESIILAVSPSRQTRMDPKTGKAAIKNGNIIVDEFADPRFDPKKLGLYDVSDMTPFTPTDEDVAGIWFREGVDDAPKPAVVAPEVVDAVLHEEPPR